MLKYQSVPTDALARANLANQELDRGHRYWIGREDEVKNSPADDGVHIHTLTQIVVVIACTCPNLAFCWPGYSGYPPGTPTTS